MPTLVTLTVFCSFFYVFSFCLLLSTFYLLLYFSAYCELHSVFFAFIFPLLLLYFLFCLSTSHLPLATFYCPLQAVLAFSSHSPLSTFYCPLQAVLAFSSH